MDRVQESKAVGEKKEASQRLWKTKS